MTLDEANIVVGEICDFIKQEKWFDFMVKQYVDNELTLHGGLSLTYPDIEIKFKDVFFTSLPMEWKTDTSAVIISILMGEEERITSEKFQVEYLHYIFKFIPEDYPDNFSCLIAAKQISYEILRPM